MPCLPIGIRRLSPHLGHAANPIHMTLCAVGLNHRTAPLDVRERLVFPVDGLQQALQALASRPGVREAAVISTCNRTEVYTVMEPVSSADTVLDWLSNSHAVDPDWLRPYLYVHQERDAVRHLLRVIPGLDSLVLGEPQIGGQSRTAYQEAAGAGTLGQVLERLFQHGFAVSKQVRTETGIGANPVSVAFAAVSLARQIFGPLENYTALLLGAGETIELTARHLRQQGLERFIVANRTRERAQGLASEYDADAIPLSELPERLAEADIVIASTASREPILSRDMVKTSFSKRRHKPVLMVDIAVPRDIEAAVAELPDVFLYTIDDLQETIRENMASREQAAAHALEIVDTRARQLAGSLSALDAVPAIRQLREEAFRQRDRSLRQAQRMLAAGRSPEAVLEHIAHTLTNRLIHQPTVYLRESGERGDEGALNIVKALFGAESSEQDEE